MELRLFDDNARGLDRFAALLVLTIGSVVLLSLLDLASIENDVARAMSTLVLSLMTGATFVLALRASGVVRRWRRFSELLVAVAVLASLVTLVVRLASDVDRTTFVRYEPGFLWLAIALLTPVAIIRRLLRHRRVTSQTLAGAVAAYLLIALAGSYLFATLDSALDDGFFRDHVAESPDFMYFSLVTLTTLGYGDLAPAESFGRLAATTLAVIGQVYLVTFVAMVVGLLIQQRDGS